MFLKLLIENRVQEYLLPVEPFLFISLQASHHKTFHVLTNLESLGEKDLSTHDFLSETFLSFLSKVPWNLTNQHLIGHDTQRPDITFMSIFLLIENLRGHIAGRSNKSFEKTLIV